jgi:hypothetical protein
VSFFITALGYYMVGFAAADFDFAGTRVSAAETYVAYVPRGATDVAWVRVFEGNLENAVPLSSGELMLHGYRRFEFFRITPDGDISEPFHFSSAFAYRFAAFYAVENGGFLAIGDATGEHIGSVPISGPPTGRAAVLHDDAGNVLAAVRHSAALLNPFGVGLQHIRADGLARIEGGYELFAGGVTRALPITSARMFYDGVRGQIVDQGFVVRVRDGVIIDRFRPPNWTVHGSSVWVQSVRGTLVQGAGPFTLPEAVSTVSRIQLAEVP